MSRVRGYGRRLGEMSRVRVRLLGGMSRVRGKG